MELDKNLKDACLQKPVDHQGHAECLLEMVGNKYLFVPERGWVVYCGTHYTRRYAESELKQDTKNLLRIRETVFRDAQRDKVADACKCSNGRVNQIMAILESEITMHVDEFDSDKDSVNALNGVINLQTGKLSAHDPAQLFTYCLPVAYHEDAEQPEQWLNFMRDIELSQEIINYLQLAFGYTLTGHIREEVMFYFYGQPRSGKGTILETITAIFGAMASTISMQSFTSKRYGDTNNFDLAVLKGKRFVTAGETDNSSSLNPAVLKRLTGGDEIFCSFKGKDHFTFRPQFVAFLASNKKINTDVEDDAVWGRLRTIHFKKSFMGSEDKGLKDRIKSPKSLEKILAWIVRGSVAWYKLGTTGLPLPDEVKQATDEHRASIDSVQQFIDDSCKLGNDCYEIGAELYASYKSWCEEEGHTPYGRKRFTSNLSNRGIESKTKRTPNGSKRCYIGVKLA